MRGKKIDQDKNVTKKSNIVLLLIDLISDFEFVDGKKLFKNTLPIAENIAELKKRAKKANVPVIYVNDNFGHWQDNFDKILEHSLKDSMRGS